MEGADPCKSSVLVQSMRLTCAITRRLPMECASAISPEWVWNKYVDEYEAASVAREVCGTVPWVPCVDVMTH